MDPKQVGDKKFQLVSYRGSLTKYFTALTSISRVASKSSRWPSRLVSEKSLMFSSSQRALDVESRNRCIGLTLPLKKLSAVPIRVRQQQRKEDKERDKYTNSDIVAHCNIEDMAFRSVFIDIKSMLCDLPVLSSWAPSGNVVVLVAASVTAASALCSRFGMSSPSPGELLRL